MTDALRRFRGAVALDLMTLALLHDRELDAAEIAELKDSGFPACLAFRLQTQQGTAALELLQAAVAELPVADGPPLHELAADYAAIYLNHGYGAAPCESVWIDDDGLTMQQPMFQVRELYARYGLSAPDWRKRTDDHLVHQLQFLAVLAERDGAETLGELARFLDEHLLRWVPDFAHRVAGRAATPLYAGLALLTAAYLDELREVVAQVLDEARPTPEEIERRLRPRRETVLPTPAPYVPGAAPSW
jgi:TorA maturation chaperone TorD